MGGRGGRATLAASTRVSVGRCGVGVGARTGLEGWVEGCTTLDVEGRALARDWTMADTVGPVSRQEDVGAVLATSVVPVFVWNDALGVAGAATWGASHAARVWMSILSASTAWRVLELASTQRDRHA